MGNLTDKKYFSKQITRRFLEAMDNIVGNTEKGKVTAGEFGEKVGIAGSNLTRLRYSSENFVTIEACGRLCHNYKISPLWLILGEGTMDLVDSKSSTPLQLLKEAVAALESSKNGVTKKVTTKKIKAL